MVFSKRIQIQFKFSKIIRKIEKIKIKMLNLLRPLFIL